MKLSTLAIVLGLGFGLPQIYGVMKPKEASAALRSFPRSLSWGFFLMLLGTFWFVYNVKNESIADFEPYKPLLLGLFLFVGIGTCIFVRDFLAVRGLAIVLLLMAKLVVDTARWSPSEFSLVLKIWAYAWIVAGIWFTVSPWRCRDLILWETATESRTRLVSGARLAFGLFIAILGATVFRQQ